MAAERPATRLQPLVQSHEGHNHTYTCMQRTDWRPVGLQSAFASRKIHTRSRSETNALVVKWSDLALSVDSGKITSFAWESVFHALPTRTIFNISNYCTRSTNRLVVFIFHSRHLRVIIFEPTCSVEWKGRRSSRVLLPA